VKKKNVVDKKINNNHPGINPAKLKIKEAQEKPNEDSRHGTYQGQKKEPVDYQNLFPRICAQKAKNALLDPSEGERPKQHRSIKHQRVLAVFCLAKEPDCQDNDRQVDQSWDDFSRKIYQDIFFHYVENLRLMVGMGNVGGDKINAKIIEVSIGASRKASPWYHKSFSVSGQILRKKIADHPFLFSDYVIQNEPIT
jgi:hypothetical protein